MRGRAAATEESLELPRALRPLVGPRDAIGRIASMGLDPSSTCEVVALPRGPEARERDGERAPGVEVWRASGLRLTAARYRPALDALDVLVVPDGYGARARRTRTSSRTSRPVRTTA